MLNSELAERFTTIVTQAGLMVAANIDKADLASGVDYASIFAASPEDFEAVTQALKAHGKVAVKSASGDYFALTEPLITPIGTIKLCRVRVCDNEHQELGYVDFEVADYGRFKETYALRPGFSVLVEGEEMIELRDPKFNVRAYFPSGPF